MHLFRTPSIHQIKSQRCVCREFEKTTSFSETDDISIRSLPKTYADCSVGARRCEYDRRKQEKNRASFFPQNRILFRMGERSPTHATTYAALARSFAAVKTAVTRKFPAESQRHCPDILVERLILRTVCALSQKQSLSKPTSFRQSLQLIHESCVAEEPPYTITEILEEIKF